MAIREILTEEDDTLRKKSRDVTEFNDKLHNLLDDMANTMYDVGGVGLAAVQIGILRKVIVIDIDEGLIELVNPEIIENEGMQDGPEGCLSSPNDFGLVERPMKVKVKAQDRNGEFFTVEGEGLLARAFCHEIDHLSGTLFKDLVSEMIDDIDEYYEKNGKGKKNRFKKKKKKKR